MVKANETYSTEVHGTNTHTCRELYAELSTHYMQTQIYADTNNLCRFYSTSTLIINFFFIQ